MKKANYEYLDAETREQLLDLMDGEYEEIVDLIETLEETNPMYFDEMEQALSEASAAGVRNAAHALKSAYAQIGAMEMSRIMKEIEETGKSGDISRTPSLWSQAKDESKKAHQAFQSWKKALTAMA